MHPHPRDPRPDAVAALDARHVWHPYTQHWNAPAPVEVVRARGATLHTRDGRTLIDAISSWWVTLHGHAEPAIADAIAEQARTLEQVIFAGFTHAPAAGLCAALARVLPTGLTRVFLSDNGSTAVEVALKIALQWWHNRGEPRRLVVALDHAYHGDTFGAMSVGARSVFSAPFDPLLFDVARLPDPSVDGDATLAAFDALLAARGREVAALIVEPLVLGAGGMRMWDEATLRALADRCRAAGVLLIADEVMTGFGRTGALFACDRAGVAPDLICLSKGITGGFLPLGATAATEALFDGFLSDDRARTLFHGHSYTANPLACAAALASLALTESDACAAARARIERAHRRHLDALATHPLVRAPRVCGTIGALDLVDARGAGSYLNPVGRELAAYALEQGVLLRPLGDACYVLPPFCTTDDELAAVYGVVARFLDGARASGA
ncbi:adenosylmethionine--8-amino-7-oxononanoate transaminase [Roseisolibacter sp. H3M3-2]|uniref:adenosylmethionine--8-amino-7-oxononanoate transaminase n=1 Tax=Roseisolibacter sp. H3M3-2 TaxID=3031323 RepID=UPI0023D9B633|nr:adenosylmethionine--8-amino-7-oxononanoate transaminase [Roseisolibacter sp. H3M3-2]MDF1506127.1 adenosylmethionine--8-amino-7-oxononanoate transaminase [Roseisolibacter sp. H3M3-2]